MVVPVRIFDDHFDIRINLFSRPDDEVLCGVCHQFETVLRPAFVAFARDTKFAFAIDKEKIVEDNLVEIFCSVLSYLLDSLSLLGIAVAESLEAIRFAEGVGDSACCFDASVVKKFLRDFESLAIDEIACIAVSFEIDFVDMNLL